MAKSYSQDLRDRVIDAVERDGMSRRAAARRFGVSESTAVKWVQRFRRTGERGPVGTGGHRPSVLAPERAWLEATLAEAADLTLEALSRRLAAERGVRADTSMLSRFLRRAGLSVKKPMARPFCKRVEGWASDQSAQTYPVSRCRGQDGSPRVPVLIKVPASSAVF